MTGAEKYLDEPYEGEEVPSAARVHKPGSRLPYLENVRHIYGMKLLKVVDADTLDVLVDLGFGVTFGIRVRCAVYDAPETRRIVRKGERVTEREVELGLHARAYAEVLLASAPRLWLQTWGRKGGYNRWVGAIWFEHPVTHEAVSYRAHMESRGYTRGAVGEPDSAETDVASTEADEAT